MGGGYSMQLMRYRQKLNRQDNKEGRERVGGKTDHLASSTEAGLLLQLSEIIVRTRGTN